MDIINETIQYIKIGETWGTTGGMLGPTIALTIGIIIAICFGTWATIACYRVEKNPFGIILPITLMVIAVIAAIEIWHSKPVYKEVPEYTITINDTVTAKEFFDTYELQSIDGDTYIVRDKGWENND